MAKAKKNNNGANLGFEATLWQAAGQAQKQYGCGRIQARGAWADFPEIHIGRL